MYGREASFHFRIRHGGASGQGRRSDIGRGRRFDSLRGSDGPRRVRMHRRDGARLRRRADPHEHLYRHPLDGAGRPERHRLQRSASRFRFGNGRRAELDRRAVGRHRARRGPGGRGGSGDDVRLRLHADRRSYAAADRHRARARQKALRGPQGGRAPVSPAGRQVAGHDRVRESHAETGRTRSSSRPSTRTTSRWKRSAPASRRRSSVPSCRR